ncbi:YPL222W-like protein [Saccharomyces cerevisiae x Saccharomyces kudriavzevii VIN7]|uniref:Selenoprotein O n=1 Tax=Saccharomyces cerevisiae x Saccharomyces kudriavzevii (strain VIN7) TaxID=1095631 RepID=H0H1T3_SACCK|nr:YPL222W-like protein [Saccharomyces cerevisiae x Saccharomyces kudriavzevii VIN7]
MMKGKVTIINALKKSATSRFIKKLTPDTSLSSIAEAMDVVQQRSAADPVRLKLFHTPRMVSQGAHFAFCLPTKKPHYRPLLLSQKALDEFSLAQDRDLERILAGEEIYYSDDIFPYSTAYSGFQFGSFAAQLGDGRVVNLFDLKDSRDGQLQTFQLKGAGMTPFSRFADGKAVLRSSIREFIMSEALHSIGIPSTRAMQLTLLPGTKAQRRTQEPCAVVCRFAPSWIRLGNFNLFRWRHDLEGLIKLSDYCIDEVFDGGGKFEGKPDVNVFKSDYFPDNERKIDEQVERDENGRASLCERDISALSKYDKFFRHVVCLNANTVAHWQAYGFANGVLNTDNTSIMGLTIDYGPFAFLDKFDPSFTPNHDDTAKRYSFANQPSIIWWNLQQFAKDLACLLGPGSRDLEKLLKGELDSVGDALEKTMIERVQRLVQLSANEYKYVFTTRYAQLMAQRLGVDLDLEPCMSSASGKDIERAAKKSREFCTAIVEPLLDILKATMVDYNNFFVHLQDYTGPFFIKAEDEPATVFEAFDPEYLKMFFNAEQLQQLAEHGKAIAAGKKVFDTDGQIRLLDEKLEKIHDWTKEYLLLAPPAEAAARASIAKKANPLFVPRSWVLEEVVDDLMYGQRDSLQDPDSELDTTALRKLYLMSVNPYDRAEWDATLRPELERKWADLSHQEGTKFMKQASCSS